VTIGHVGIVRVKKFRYLGSIIQQKGDVDEDIKQQINIGY